MEEQAGTFEDPADGHHRDAETSDDERPRWPPTSWPAEAAFLVQNAADAAAIKAVVIGKLLLTIKAGHQFRFIKRLVHRATSHPENLISVHNIGEDLQIGSALEAQLKIRHQHTNSLFIARLHGEVVWDGNLETGDDEDPQGDAPCADLDRQFDTNHFASCD